MSVPSLPPFYDMPYTDEKGMLSSSAHLYNDQLWQSLNAVVNFFNNGIQFPQKTTAEITVYRDDDTVPTGTTWYNTNLNKLQVKTALGSPGTIETVQSV